MAGLLKGGENMLRKKERSNRTEDVARLLDEATELFKLSGEFHALARIGDFNFPATERADVLFNEIVSTFETEVPVQEASRARRGREGEVTELSRKIFVAIRRREPEAEDEISLRWIATRLRRALNDAKLRQLKRDHNSDPCPQNL